jgi:hypothetical protein
MEANRTFIGSVVCVDLVGYSKRSIAQQGEIKEAFNKLLTQTLRKVPAEDRIILDTGDGAAISFLGDPEESLVIGLKIRDSMNHAAAKLGANDEGGPVRIGINLGPLRVKLDMNGHPKIIGDGLNVAETICAFANPGQVVVSRPFHDMVSRISDKHRQIFHYEGARTDRNVREHEIYSVISAAAELAGSAKTKTLPPVPQPKVVAAPPASAESGMVAFLRDPKKWGVAAALLAGIVIWELSVVASRMGSPSVAKPVEVAKAPELPKAEPPKPEPPKVAEAPKVVAPPVVEPPKKVETPKVEPPKGIEPPKKWSRSRAESGAEEDRGPAIRQESRRTAARDSAAARAVRVDGSPRLPRPRRASSRPSPCR